MKKQEIFAAHEANPAWHVAQLARHCGVSSSYVSRIAKDAGLQVPCGQKGQPGVGAAIRLGWAAIHAGLSINDIEQAGRAKQASA